MPKLLFDTNVFINYWRGDPAARALVDGVIDGTMIGEVSLVTAVELWQSTKFTRREEIEFVALTTILAEATVDLETAREIGLTLRPMSRQQRAHRTADAILAVTARRRGLTVCTRNTRDFVRYDVPVESY